MNFFQINSSHSCIFVFLVMHHFVSTKKVSPISHSTLDCDKVLGLSTGLVSDYQMTSSSSASETNSSKTARLNPLHDSGTGWVPRTSDHQQWLLVDLKRRHTIKAVLTQGCGNGKLWVTLFKMFHGDSEDGLYPYLDQNSRPKVRRNQ